MSPLTRPKSLLILLGDVLALYAALGLTLLARYGWPGAQAAAAHHLFAFSIIFPLWLFIFYVGDLYHIRELKIGERMVQKIAGAAALSTTLSVIVFYLFGAQFELTPKTNLLIFAVFFVAAGSSLRFLIIRSFVRYARVRLLILGVSPAISELTEYLGGHPQLGYDVAASRDTKLPESIEEFRALVAEGRAHILIVAPALLREHPELTPLLYRLLYAQIEVATATDFYERVFQKIPLDEVDESWFVEAITTRHRLYDTAKRALDIVLTLTIGILLFPLMLAVALLTRLTSPGPALYSHKRTGQGGEPFTLYKFRSMYQHAQGPSWTARDDRRITPMGKILRRTHLDELPQLWNILTGDLSFIGPRAESCELASLYRELPHYDIRHLIKPGLTGWAQLNYRPSASLEEAKEKLMYDIYYVKNRNAVLDLLILIKTLRYFFLTHDR